MGAKGVYLLGKSTSTGRWQVFEPQHLGNGWTGQVQGSGRGTTTTTPGGGYLLLSHCTPGSGRHGLTQNAEGQLGSPGRLGILRAMAQSGPVGVVFPCELSGLVRVERRSQRVGWNRTAGRGLWDWRAGGAGAAEKAGVTRSVTPRDRCGACD